MLYIIIIIILPGVDERFCVHPDEFPCSGLAIHGQRDAVFGVSHEVNFAGFGDQGGEDDRTGLSVKRVVGHVDVAGCGEHSARQPLDGPVVAYAATERKKGGEAANPKRLGSSPRFTRKKRACIDKVREKNEDLFPETEAH